ncbi:MAG: prenyltransferase/squalene oxidase repeat-containing protein [Planctomycetota bacterium]|jgi:hypothetical protein
MKITFSTFIASVAFAMIVTGSMTRAKQPADIPDEQLQGVTESNLSQDELIRIAVDELIGMQQEDGAWPYEGVYRVQRQIPVGYQVGGTALAAQALIHASTKENHKANAAINKALTFVIKNLGHRLMAPSQEDKYDVRVWGHACALECLCQIKLSQRLSHDKKKANGTTNQARNIDAWITALTRTLVTQEIKGGGWNYANQRYPATFVTAPVMQALLWARKAGEEVPDETLERGIEVLLRLKTGEGAFHYSGSRSTAARKNARATIPGSAARSALCEATLRMLGKSSPEDTRAAVANFFTHWDELEKRRKKTGTHVPPYGIAPYYFYFGHRYTAQAIQFLSPDDKQRFLLEMRSVLLKTRDPDGTWNDRIFPRSSNYGTAMAIMALLEDKMPAPSLPPS